RKDYNEVFSPYSSPSTVNWDNQPTGIFIYLESQIGNTANFKIYQADANTPAEDAILAVTPPSRPMLYKPIEIFNCNGNWGYPRVIWDNNKEPDMLRNSNFKRYKVYRAMSVLDELAPYNYEFIGYYDDHTPNDTANYIDNSPLNGVRIYCNGAGFNENDTYYRYEITAVDEGEMESVKSDFVSIKGHSNIPDNPYNFINVEKPDKFYLNQNLPNPFNPTTKIKFALPKNVNVTLKIYDMLGKEV